MCIQIRFVSTEQNYAYRLACILFAMYTDGLLERLENTGVGCHMGCRFVGALAHADDITLLAPCKSAHSILISDCENYAAEYDNMFNGNKSKLLLFKGRSSVMVPSEIMVNGEIVDVFDNSFLLYRRRIVIALLWQLGIFPEKVVICLMYWVSIAGAGCIYARFM